MWSTSRTRLAVLLSLVVLAPTPGARAGETGDEVNADPRALVAQAAERWELYHDPNGALQLLDRAVEMTDGEAWVLLRRANFLETVSGVATADQVEQLEEAARADYRRVAGADPDSVTAGVARLDGRQLLPLATVSCPPGAVEAFSAAERMFNTGRFDEAIHLHLLDESLVGEFCTFRDAHADRLVDYLLTVVVPARQSAIAEPPG